MTRPRQTIAVLALVGLFIALYLWFHRIGLIGVLSCGVEGGCETVQTSPYAVLWGSPVALYGVGGYAALLALSLVGLHPRLVMQHAVTTGLLGLATAGFGFTLYLKYVEFFVIHAVCRWCVASAVIITAIWVVALLAWRAERTARAAAAEQAPRSS